MTLRARAHAKVNLALTVVGRRKDGFHELRSVFIRLALHDELAVDLAPADAANDRLVVRGDASVPVEGNLVLRAAARAREVIDASLPLLAFDLHKRIPAAAGLAGGSSDAASALALALEAWDVRIEPGDRRALALGIGADVPFFDAGTDAALVSGIGEGLEPLPGPSPPAGVVLVTPRGRLSTADVFSAWDEGARPNIDTVASAAVDSVADALRQGSDGGTLVSLLVDGVAANDLWLAAQRHAPALAPLAAELGAATDAVFHLTGSGSTLFAVVPTTSEADALAERLATAPPILGDRATVISTATTSRLTTTEGG